VVGANSSSAQAFPSAVSTDNHLCSAVPYRIRLCRIVPLIHFDEDGDPEAVLLC
jgi:hypothetical protein